MSEQRLLSSFCVYGLQDDAPIHLNPVSETSETANELNTIVSLRLLVLEGEEIMKCSSELLDYLLLSTISGKGLWLEIGYGRSGSHIRPGWTPSDPAITSLSFYYMASDGETLQIPSDLGYEPVPVIYRVPRPHHKTLEPVHGTNRYTGTYDLTMLLGAKHVPTHHLVMVYKTSVLDPPIIDLKIVVTSAFQKVDGKIKRVVVIPEGYEQINYLIGNNHNSILCYKREKEPWNLTFQASLIQRFPEDPEAEHLAKASAMFCFPAGLRLTHEEQALTSFSYVLTSVPGNDRCHKEGRLYVTCVIFSEIISPDLRKALRIQSEEKLYAPKCICLSSYWPYLENCVEILKCAFQLSVSGSDFPLERFICNVLHDIPLPDQGKTVVQYRLPSTVLSYQRPSLKSIPEISQPHLQILFQLLKLADIILIWCALMQERKVILHSSLRSVLTPVSLALTGLLFPYKWEHVLIPILPDQLIAFTETIFPYLIGTSSDVNRLPIPAEALVVLLDSGSVTCKEPVPDLPDKLHNRLTARLQVYSNLFHNGPQLTDEVFPSVLTNVKDEAVKVDPILVQDAFLEMQCELIRDYDLFFHIPSPGAQVIQSSLSYINLPEYIKARKLKPENFLYQFLNTTLFTRFIEGRCFSYDSNTQHSYFDM